MPMHARDTILLVDGSTEIRESLGKIFEEKYNILEARNSEQALFLARQNMSSIVSVIIGVELLANDEGGFIAGLKEREESAVIPVIAIIPENDVQAEYCALELGVNETISYPFYHEIVDRRVGNMISLYVNKWELMHLVKKQEEWLLHSNETAVDALISTIESRSMESAQHILRIRRFTQILLNAVAQNCPEYNLDEKKIRTISNAASLHDIGKISIPDAILNKPGRLTEEEFEVMKTHTTSGGAILKRMAGMGNEEYLRYAYNICLYHHERWDGKGYPDGLAGDDIPICAQAVGIADAYDALTTERVYKAAISHKDVVNMILRGDCGTFSPKLLECFKLVISDFALLAEKYADGEVPTSDDTEVPLDPPSRTPDRAVQYMLAKYEVLLHHMGAAVVEIDLDSDVFQLVYNPNPDLMLLNNAGSLEEAVNMLARDVIHPDDREMVVGRFREYLKSFFHTGLRKRVRRYRIRGELGTYRYYNVTTLRIANDANERKALLIWQPDETTPATDAAEMGERLNGRNTFGGFSFCCINDRWLTMTGDLSEISEYLGYTEAEFFAEHENRLSSLIPQGEYDSIYKQITKQLNDGVDVEVEIPLYHKNGGIRWAIMKAVVSNGDHGTEVLVGLLIDITGSKMSNREFLEYLGYHRLVFERAGDVPFQWSIKNERIVMLGKHAKKFLKNETLVKDEMCELDVAQFHPDDIPVFRKKMHALTAGDGFTEFTIRIANSGRKYVWHRVRAAASYDRDGNVVAVVGVFMDVDDSARNFMSLSDNSERDSLTKLLNKEAARRQIEICIDTASNSAISAMVIIDLDNFKSVNDNFGHLFGDTLLMRVSAEICNLFRGTDVVARIGGDEFLVYMSNIPHRSLVEKRCGALIETIGKIYEEQLAGVGFACSAGIAFLPEHGNTYTDLFKRADSALYLAKRMGKNRYSVYDPSEVGLAMTTTMVNRRIDSNEEIGMANNSLARYVFHRLYESGNVSETIQSILEIVGRQIEVSRVYIFENNADNTSCSNTFEWCNDGVEPQIDNLQNVSYETDIPDYEKNFNESGIFYVPDVSELPQHLRDILEPQGICSLLHCAIWDNGQFRGYVGFDDNTEIRLWTKEQIDIITFLGQMISVFLLKQRVQDETEKSIEDLRNVLNNQYSWTYVIEPETFKLQFINKRTSEIAPMAEVGAKCYEVFMGRNTPCPNCPVLAGNPREVIIQNPHLKVDVNAVANTIRWRGKNAWIVMCSEISELSENDNIE